VTTREAIDNAGRQFGIVLAILAAILFLFALLVGCDRLETPVDSMDRSQQPLVVNWSVDEVTGMLFVSAINGVPNTTVINNRVIVPNGGTPRSSITVARVAEPLGTSTTSCISTAMFFGATLPERVSAQVEEQMHDFEPLPLPQEILPIGPVALRPAVFVYPPPFSSQARVRAMEIGRNATNVTMHLTKLTLTDKRLRVPAALTILSPWSRTVVSRNSNLVVRFEGELGMSAIAVLTGVPRDSVMWPRDTVVISPVKSARYVVKELARGMNSVTFTAEELQRIQESRAVIHIASADVKLVNGGAVSLVGQSTASVMIELSSRTAATRDGVEFALNLRRTTLASGDTLSGTFSITNRSGTTQRFNFSTSCQLSLRLSANERVWIEQPEICAQVLTSFEVRSGEERIMSFQVPLRQAQTGLPLPAGEYTLEVGLRDANSPVLRQTIRVQ
jgi:hypothetical protein